MNSSLQVNLGATTPVECTIYDLVGGVPQHFSTQAYTIIVVDIIILLVTCPFTVVLNLLTMIAVKMKRRLQSMSNIALACLATTDLMVGVLVQPLFISVAISALQSQATQEVCRRQIVTKYSINFFVFSSLAHLAVMSADRYLAIKQSYTYEQTVTKTRVLIASAIAWMSSSAVLITQFIKNEIFLTVQNLLGLVLMVSIAICSVVVYREARRHEIQIAELQASVEARERFLKEKRALKLTIIIVVMVFLNYMPIISFRFIRRALKDKVSLDILHAMYFPAASCVIFNSFVNPLIYSVRSRQFRIAFIEILLRKTNAEAEEFEMRLFGSQNANHGGEGEQNVNQETANIAMETNQEGEREEQDVNQANTNTNQGGEREKSKMSIKGMLTQTREEREKSKMSIKGMLTQSREERERGSNVNQVNTIVEIETNQGGKRGANTLV